MNSTAVRRIQNIRSLSTPPNIKGVLFFLKVSKKILRLFFSFCPCPVPAVIQVKCAICYTSVVKSLTVRITMLREHSLCFVLDVSIILSSHIHILAAKTCLKWSREKTQKSAINMQVQGNITDPLNLSLLVDSFHQLKQPCLQESQALTETLIPVHLPNKNKLQLLSSLYNRIKSKHISCCNLLLTMYAGG